MTIAFEVSELISASPEAIYQAWVSSAGHTAMTGSPAEASDIVGATFSAWDGYIFGHNLELEPGVRIVQAWRTSEFAENEADSRLEVVLTAHEDGTLVTIRHSNLPVDGEQYRQGWLDYYFAPMQEYFARRANDSLSELD